MKIVFLLVTAIFAAGCSDPTTTNRPDTDLQRKLDQLQTESASTQAQLAYLKNAVDAYIKVSLQAYEEDRDAHHKEQAPARLYVLTDPERSNANFAAVFSSRPITVGELISVNGDIWEVKKIRVDTELLPPNDASKAAKMTIYSISETALFVKFYGKVQPSTPAP